MGLLVVSLLVVLVISARLLLTWFARFGHVPCISRSGSDMKDERKTDFAISQGINLEEVRTRVGYSWPPHASDTTIWYL